MDVTMIAIIPEPVELIENDGNFTINNDTIIVCKDDLSKVLTYSQKLLTLAMGFQLKNGKKRKSNTISFELEENKELGE